MTITVDKHSYIGQPANEYFDPKVTIGKYCSIAEDVIWCGSINHPSVLHKELVTNYNFGVQWQIPWMEKWTTRGPIIVGHDVWIGRGAVIMDGVTIGNGAIVGMFAIVTKSVPPYAVVAGNPARIKHYRFTPEQIKKLEALEWWNWDEATIKSRLEDFKDVNKLIEKYHV